MAVTDLASVANQIQKFWSPMFMKELRASLLLGALVNKDYDGEIKKMGDRVRVSQINAPAGQLLTVAADGEFALKSNSTGYPAPAIGKTMEAIASGATMSPGLG